MTRTIEIPIPDELLTLIDQRARREGVERAEYIQAVLSREMKTDASVSEILAPFRAEVAASGITDEELNGLFEEAREESFNARRPRRQ